VYALGQARAKGLAVSADDRAAFPDRARGIGNTLFNEPALLDASFDIP
jgi:hypothetical protein